MAMEALLANITGTCPLPFQGVTGQLFASAVAAVVAAHCSIFDDYRWPRNNAEEIIETGPLDFDFIVVGAGTAGSAIAGRLTDLNPLWTVLLVEAGGDPTLNSEVPSFLIYNQDIDWKYETKPDNRSCLANRDNKCIWNKGKALGGSSAINAMLYVRGHSRDYDTWKDLGNTGWGYDELSPYFEAIENKLNFQSYKYHENPWYNILRSSYENLGLPSVDNDKNEGAIGTKVTKLVTRDGKRLNTAKLFLKERDNFFLMKNSEVQKVIIDSTTLTAKGIEIKYKNEFVIQIQARKEIILSAGSVATPKIMMQSGIGPQVHLNDKGIECLVDLPVGQNLQDHIILPLFFKTNMQIELTPNLMISYILQYMLHRTGPLSNLGLTDYMSFINTKNDSNYPNIQFHHGYFFKKDNIMLKSYLEGLGYKKEIVNSILKINQRTDFLGIYPSLLHPKSRGEIKLSGSSPESMLEIITNYYQDPNDVKILIEGIRYARKLKQTRMFKSLGIEFLQIELPDCKNTSSDSDDYWDCYIRHFGTSLYHPIGTTKMGPKYDPAAVVNYDLTVHKMHNLRVVDASIMPTIPGGNTMAATLVIAEKAFDIIKMHYKSKDEL